MKRHIPLLLALLVGLGLLLNAMGVRAQRFPRELENIKMFGRGETIEFLFSQPYEGSPVTDHKPGVFALTFSGTGSTKPVRALRPVEESIYREIKVVENRYSTTVSFELKDRALNLTNRLNFTPDRNVLRVAVNAPPPATPSSPQGQATQELLREMESRINGGAGSKNGAPAGAAAAAAGAGAAAEEGGPLALGDLGGSQFFWSLVTMVIALVLIVGGLYGVLYLYNRFLAGRLRGLTGVHSIRQVASFHIGPRQRIVVLDINGEVIACGVTPTQITYLTHLGGQGPVGRVTGNPIPGLGSPPGPQEPPTTGGGAEPVHGAALALTQKAIAVARRKAAGTEGAAPIAAAERAAAGLAAEPNPTGNDPVHEFAEVLKQKVRSLKRIN